MNPWLLLAPLLAAAPLQDPADGFVDLLARGLDGWVPVNTAPSTWRIEEGMLRCTGKPTGELRTARMYQNFVLEVEWRHLVPKGNAGIFVWADDITARGVPFHRSIEVQVLENAYGNTRDHTTHGDIFPIHGATMTPLNGRGGSRAFPTAERSKPSPEWNHYRVTCVDGAITLEVNGAVVTRGTDCVPRKGYLCLESEGGVVDYRNIRIRELPDTPLEPALVATADRGYRTLYDGLGLDGWRPGSGAGESWSARDWVLAFDGGGAGDRSLTTTEEFGDHRFLFDVHRGDGAGVPVVLVRGAVEVRVDPEELGARLEAGWNRFEGALVGSRFTLSLNGWTLVSDRELEKVPATGPLRIVPQGPVELANLFVAPID